MKLENIINQPSFEADRFDLRPMRGSDAGLVEFYTKDERVARMTPSIPHPLPPGATEAMIARATTLERDEDIWVIDGMRSGLSEVIGLVSLQRLSKNQSELSYWVAPAFWNKGVGLRSCERPCSTQSDEKQNNFCSRLSGQSSLGTCLDQL